MSWLTFLIAIGLFNVGLVLYLLLLQSILSVKRRLMLRRLPQGRMVPISSHPRFNDRRAS